MAEHKGWIGVDFDGTLAHYTGWVAADHCGAPIAPMVDRVKAWLAEGREVRIFTARIYPITQVIRVGNLDYVTPPAGVNKERYAQACQAAVCIQDYCHEHIGVVLPITCVKDYGMVELWDDRAVQVHPNLGTPVDLATYAPECRDLLTDPDTQRTLIGAILELCHGGALSLSIADMNSTQAASGGGILEVQIDDTHYHIRSISSTPPQETLQ